MPSCTGSHVSMMNLNCRPSKEKKNLYIGGKVTLIRPVHLGSDISEAICRACIMNRYLAALCGHISLSLNAPKRHDVMLKNTLEI